MRTARLALEDGSIFQGRAFGAGVESAGEVVFNTSMTGYQEICTDPSYRGQMVVMTYPLIGNYGVTPADDESRRPWVNALIVRECSDDYSNWRADDDLHDYLARNGIAGLCDVDTRALTRRLRTTGTIRGVISLDPSVPNEALVARARAVTPLSEQPVVAETSIAAVRRVAAMDGEQRTEDGGPTTDDGRRTTEALAWRRALRPRSSVSRPRSVAVLDVGAKENIVRSLVRRGVEVTVYPYNVDARTILGGGGEQTPGSPLRVGPPDGIVICNGPGDPASLPEPVALVRDLIDTTDIPIFGICLGHQILARAIGAETGRLKFGHHGANHPVKDLETGRVHITSQNHEFQVLRDTIPPESGFYVSQEHLNDRSVEGLAHRERPIFSVQYHPEGSPGPQDNQYLFDRFLGVVRARRER